MKLDITTLILRRPRKAGRDKLYALVDDGQQAEVRLVDENFCTTLNLACFTTKKEADDAKKAKGVKDKP